MGEKKRGIKDKYVHPWVWIPSVVVLVLLVAGMDFLLVKQKEKTASSKEVVIPTIPSQQVITAAPTQVSSSSTSPVPTLVVDMDTSHWKTYTNAKYSIKYPENWYLVN